MDMDLKDIVEAVHTGLRSVGAEGSSPWFYVQFGLILAGAGIAFATNAAIHARVDKGSPATHCPRVLRHFMGVLISSAATAVFAMLMIVFRLIMSQMTWPSRSYL